MMYIKPRKSGGESISKKEKDLMKMVLEDVEDPMKLKKEDNRGMSLRAKFLLIFIFSVAGMLAVLNVGIRVAFSWQEWNEDYYLAKHPIFEAKRVDGYKSTTFAYTFNKPITIEKKEKKVSYIPVISGSTGASTPRMVKVLTQEEKERVVADSGLSKIIRGVWILETNEGKNSNDYAHHNDCSKVGMTNEFGYMALDNYCFASFEESVDTVTKWFEKELKTKNLSESLCFYSEGKVESTCNYAISFAKLDADGKLASK